MTITMNSDLDIIKDDLKQNKNRKRLLTKNKEIRKLLFEWCLATNPKSNAMICYIGKEYFIKKNEEKAIEWFLIAAGSGDLIAMKALAYIYRHGPHKTNIVKAIFWYEKAFELGDLSSANSLGFIYRNIYKEEDKAILWYKKAAEESNIKAFWNLGICYSLGSERIRNEFKAAEFFSVAWKLEKDPPNKKKYLNELQLLFPSKKAEYVAEYFYNVYNSLNKNISLEKEIERLKVELDFRPGGAGTLKAEAHFYEVASSIR